MPNGKKALEPLKKNLKKWAADKKLTVRSVVDLTPAEALAIAKQFGADATFTGVTVTPDIRKGASATGRKAAAKGGAARTAKSRTTAQDGDELQGDDKMMVVICMAPSKPGSDG